jgi:Tol biopolymer transport system component
VEDAVLTGLEKLPADRFATAAEFGAALVGGRVGGSAGGRAGGRRAKQGAAGGSSRAVLGAAAAGAVLLGALGYWLGARTAHAGGAAITLGRATPVTWDPGLEVHPAISPDGRLVAYAAGPVATRLRVFVRPVAGGRSVPLVDDTTGTQSSPRWSPDGTRVLFLARNAVFSAPSFGGPARSEVPPRSNAVNWADWSPDGTTIGFAAGDSIFVRPEGGDARFVAELFEPALCSWSPDGRALACASGNLQYAVAGLQFANLSPSQIIVVDVATGALDTLTDRSAANQSPLWLDDERLLFISNRHGSRDIYSLDVSGGRGALEEPVRVTTGLGAHSISLSADARLIAYAAISVTSNVWAAPIPTGGPASPYDAKQVTHGNQMIESFTVSPDGKWLVYDSDLAGNADIYRVPIGGGEPERLTTDPSDDFFPTLSPDGREIAFHSWRTGNRDIFVQPLDGGPVQQVTATPARQEVNAIWSPDGSALAFFDFEGRFDQVTRSPVYIARRTPSGWDTATALAPLGNWPSWSPDGRRLAYATGTIADRIFVADADGANPHLAYDARASRGPTVEQVVWSADGRSLFFKSHDGGGRATVYVLPSEGGGQPRLLTLFDDPARPSARFNLAADAERLYFGIDERRSDVWVMEVEQLGDR